jgi:tRNA dimethylallyltransferase
MGPLAVCLMGPTAAGKTELAISLCKRFPFEIISVDSAMVYRGMNIGTAKPDAATLARTPHRLIDIRDPEQAYSAGDFVRDAGNAISEVHAAGRVPLLVGGTMMYFRALTAGIAALPTANAELRAEIDVEAQDAGWPAMHAALASIDAESAARISPNDSQRIQRALEVFRVSGKPLSQWQAEAAPEVPGSGPRYLKLALQLRSRERVHERIELRLNSMLNNGFQDEVHVLQQREQLSREAPSMRAVGYRQFWAHAAGECSFDDARYRTLVATRQLAKRQITWLRAESSLPSFDPQEAATIDAVSSFLASEID